MKRSPYNRQWTGSGAGIAAAALTLLGAAPSAFAQQGPPPQGGPPPGGFGGGGPGRMMGQPMRMPEVSAATVPVRALERALGLSDDQKTKLRALAFTLMEDRRDAQPPPPDMMMGGGPDNRAAMQEYQEQMRAAGEKTRALDAKAAKDIEALLTADQKRKLPDVLAEATLLRDVGLPMEATGDLALTADQKAKLKTIAAEGMPRPGGPGGPGGFGPGGGGPGQPPRPGGGPPGGGGAPPPPGGPGGPGGGFQQFRRMQEGRMERVMDVLTEAQRVKARDYLRRYRRPMMGGGMMMGPGMMGPGGPGGGGRPGFGPGGGPGQPPPPGRGV